MKYGFIRAAAASPDFCLGSVSANTALINESITRAFANGAQVIVFPRLAITGGEMKAAPLAFSAVEPAIREIAAATKGKNLAAVAGASLLIDGREVNASLVFGSGALLAVVPETPAPLSELDIAGFRVPCASPLLLTSEILTFGIASGKDSLSAAARLARAGARLILFPEDIPLKPGAFADFKMRYSALTKEYSCAALAASLNGGSVSGSCYTGFKLIAEAGEILACGDNESDLITADIDTGYLAHLNRRSPLDTGLPAAEVRLASAGALSLLTPPDPRPFLPAASDFDSALNALADAVHSRMSHANCGSVILGVSGGLDSANVLVIAAHMCIRHKLDPQSVIALTMNTAHSSERTKANALKLIKALKVTHIDLPIDEAVAAHLQHIGHSEKDVVYENAQARERAQILLSLGNKYNALVLGTADLSERALGFSTYGGDLLAHYNPNIGLPKTYLRAFITHIAEHSKNAALKDVLLDIVSTPVSPELLPNQLTEKILGSYDLNDFFLYHLLVRGAGAEKLLYLAAQAFPDKSAAGLKKVLDSLLSRLFRHAFKRSFSCDGPYVTQVTGEMLDFPPDAGRE